jgi:hypothetical protein
MITKELAKTYKVQLTKDLNKMESVVKDCLDELITIESVFKIVDGKHEIYGRVLKPDYEIYKTSMRMIKNRLFDFPIKHPCSYVNYPIVFYSVVESSCRLISILDDLTDWQAFRSNNRMCYDKTQKIKKMRKGLEYCLAQIIHLKTSNQISLP